MHENLFLELSKKNEFALKFKSAKTPLTLLQIGDNYMIQGFFDNDEEDIVKLAEDVVFDKSKGEIVHYKGGEDYVSMNFTKEELIPVLENSKYFMC